MKQLRLSIIVNGIWDPLEVLIFIYSFRIGKFASIQTYTNYTSNLDKSWVK